MDIDLKEKCYDILKSIEHFSKVTCIIGNGTFPFRCVWKGSIEFLIHKNDLQFYNYFKDYFDIINMLHLNGTLIVNTSSSHYYDGCDCKHQIDCKHKKCHTFYEFPKIHGDSTICKCNDSYYFIYGKTLYHNGVRYDCTYKNIREELKDVIDEILSKNKVIINE